MFQRAFEQANYKFASTLLKPLLRYVLPHPDELDAAKGAKKEAKKDDDGDDLMPDQQKKTKKSGNKNMDHVRMNAIKIFLSVVDAAKGNSQLLEALADSLQLIGSILGTVVKSCEAWKDKRVQKTNQALGIYTKLSKTIVMKSYCGEEVKYRPRLESSSLKLQ